MVGKGDAYSSFFSYLHHLENKFQNQVNQCFCDFLKNRHTLFPVLVTLWAAQTGVQ